MSCTSYCLNVASSYTVDCLTELIECIYNKLLYKGIAKISYVIKSNAICITHVTTYSTLEPGYTIEQHCTKFVEVMINDIKAKLYDKCMETGVTEGFEYVVLEYNEEIDGIVISLDGEQELRDLYNYMFEQEFLSHPHNEANELLEIPETTETHDETQEVCDKAKEFIEKAKKHVEEGKKLASEAKQTKEAKPSKEEQLKQAIEDDLEKILEIAFNPHKYREAKPEAKPETKQPVKQPEVKPKQESIYEIFEDEFKNLKKVYNEEVANIKQERDTVISQYQAQTEAEIHNILEKLRNSTRGIESYKFATADVINKFYSLYESCKRCFDVSLTEAKAKYDKAFNDLYKIYQLQTAQTTQTAQKPVFKPIRPVVRPIYKEVYGGATKRIDELLDYLIPRLF